MLVIVPYAALVYKIQCVLVYLLHCVLAVAQCIVIGPVCGWVCLCRDYACSVPSYAMGPAGPGPQASGGPKQPMR